MAPRIENIFAGLPRSLGREQTIALFENEAVKIERIVSQRFSSPAGFWYDQSEDEWVIVLRGRATLQFEEGETIEMTPGDHVTLRSHVKHRVLETDAETIWLAVHMKTP